jgi:vitamin B12 transporter
MLARFALLLIGTAAAVSAQSPVNLPPLTVYSPRVANQTPAGTFAMPVSALRYEPLVDIEARNLAEGQADVTVRGGIFESTGFQIGGLTLTDPQTGHYFADIPVAPAMLTAPEILTGADLAARLSNATAGAVSYAWRPIQTAGMAAIGGGEYGLARAELYQGWASPAGAGNQRFGFDFAVAHSEADGSVPFGEHRFDRVNGRVQLSNATSQTDLFVGYQAKFFGWPNLYTPFNSNETENLQTLLLVLNSRVSLGGTDFVEAGAYYRRNKDDYAFNRFAPLTAVHPFQHTTQVSGASLGVQREAGGITYHLRGEILTDDLKSTSLTAGRYHNRTLGKLTFIPEKTWRGSDGAETALKFGATYDNSSHEGGGVVTPVLEWSHSPGGTAAPRFYASYSAATQIPSYTALNSSATGGLFRGNADLGREKAENAELGVRGSAAGWSGNAAVFWRHDESLVDWTFRRGVTARTANPVDVDTSGVELVARRSWNSADVVVGYTALFKDADYRGAAVDASFYALNYARHRLTAAFTLRLSPEWEVRLDNVARIQADNLLRVVGGNRAVFSSLGIAYRPHGWRGAEVSVQIDNLWDSEFQEVPAVPAARRQASGGLRYTW